MNTKVSSLLLVGLVLFGISASGREYHVSITGSDDGNGSAGNPFRTITEAVRITRAGDTVTIHAGTYREWVDPLYGGTSDLNRVVYRAAEGEEVVISGAEVIKGWEKIRKGVWKVTLDNKLFGEYNPYREIVRGDWFLDFGRDHHTGEVYLNGKSFYEIDSPEKVFGPEPLEGSQDPEGSLFQWYCESDSRTTTIWANFHGFDPNQELVEINVRPAVFFPKKTGIDYITVSGFTLTRAATNWAPPTAEQGGLIGPHWSRGWIIEDNIISHSKCSGISLGKDRSTGQNYSSEYKVKNGHISQLEVVFQALNSGWSRENVGSHIVRNNEISHCEQTGICGDMGAVFSRIQRNHIHDIYTKRQWGGFEMGGIKLHAPIDVLIQDNCIHDAFKGMWIDWQAQGIRITGNLLYDNSWMDLHMEVSHGPHIIDNNLFLSDLNLWNLAVGSAYVQNLFAGQICRGEEHARFTPYHVPHSTKVAGLMTTQGGDDRFLNNLFIKTPAPPYDIFEKAKRPKRRTGTMDYGLGMYGGYPAGRPAEDYFIGEMSEVRLPVRAEGNVYLNGAVPCENGVNEVAIADAGAAVRLEEREDGLYLVVEMDKGIPLEGNRILCGTDLGVALVPGSVFENPDGSPVRFDRDYFNLPREEQRNAVGPFAGSGVVESAILVWPR